MHNPTEGNILVCSEVDGGCYELITFSLTNAGGSVTDGKRGSCLGPGVFLGRNRFAVLDRHKREIVVKNLNNETTKRVSAPLPNVDCLYDGGASGRIILRADDRAVLFEVQSRRVIGELTAPKIKNVVWSPDGSKVALLCKYGVVIANRQLEQLCSISDTVRIKSGAWDVSPSGGTSSNLFIYTTLHHVKYCLPTGDTGTIRTLDNPIYATRVVKDQLFCLDREARSRVISIDTTEARFKLALANKKVSASLFFYLFAMFDIFFSCLTSHIFNVVSTDKLCTWSNILVYVVVLLLHTFNPRAFLKWLFTLCVIHKLDSVLR